MAIAKNHAMNPKCSLLDREVQGSEGTDRKDFANRGYALKASRMVEMRRYAWLEHEGGLWHFLTDLFADPRDSNRQWSDRQRALDELLEEGWTVVRPYPGQPAAGQISGNRIHGYGLMQTTWVNQPPRRQ
jgi:hypothetical protein